MHIISENDPTITCPHCQTVIKLTESLAAPLIAATKEQYENKLSQQLATLELKENQLREQAQAIAQQQKMFDEKVAQQVAKTLEHERQHLINEESRKAKAAASLDLEMKTREINELQNILHDRNQRLAEAQKSQAEWVRKQRELEDEKRELDLTIEKRVQAALQAVRLAAKIEAEEGMKLKVLEKDQTIVSMQQKIEELKQKAEQGSQQLQGEVQEIELESILRSKFPLDLIEPVPKGEFGGDILQRVMSPSGNCCGTILWESKRTKHWSDTWLSKLRDDQRTAKAEVAILVSQTLPKGVDTFDVIDGVWVTSPRALVPVTTLLRHTLLQVQIVRIANEGQQTKTEWIYQYLTGPRFKQRVEAIVEAFTTLQEDLDKERRVIMKQWEKRQVQIDRVVQATVGMYGDLQGIAGTSLQEIAGLEFPALED